MTITIFLIAIHFVRTCQTFQTGPFALRKLSRNEITLNAVSDEWTSDFDDFVGDGVGSDDKNNSISSLLSSSHGRNKIDLTGVQTRLFSLGGDLIINDFIGNMGFEEVTDWEYYYENEDNANDRNVVNPNPFDKSKPKRTRTSSGSVVRVFRGEFIGRLGASIKSRGLDARILIKEYTGELALQLAKNEQDSIARLQSKLVEEFEDAENGGWIQAASSRSVLGRTDDKHIGLLLQKLAFSSYLGILGEVNLAELEDELDPNDFYRALGVPPPKPGAIWIVYEYQGLNTVASYVMMPPAKRRANQPVKKSFFGGFVEPPPLPSFRERANFIVKGMMAQSLHALSTLHEAGIAHRSIGRSSLFITSQTQNKAEPSSIYFTQVSGLVMKLSDFGFSGLLEESGKNDEFLSRAQTFGLLLQKGESSQVATKFAIAEDLHALGFVFLGLLLVSLSDLPNSQYPMPATDEDTLQKLLYEIFDQDFTAFRDYVKAEEVWGELVKLLDENDGAGWNLLESMFKAREKVAEDPQSVDLTTAGCLLSNKFFE